MDPAQAALRAGRVVCADSVGRALLAMAVPPEQRRGGVLSRVPVLGRHGGLPGELRRVALAAETDEEALPVACVEHVDAEAVARWIVGRHRSVSYPAVVLGSPHGAAVHLAVACGAAWLPSSFTITTPWPGGSPGDWRLAMSWGARLAEQIIARNPGVTVRQVHDPVLRGALCGTSVSLQVRWQTLPEAYRTFLRSRIAPGGACVLVRDLRTWPVLDGPPGYSFQIGSPTSGWGEADYRGENEAFRRLLRRVGAEDWSGPWAGTSRNYAETSGEPAVESQLRKLAAASGSAGHRVLYTDPRSFSAAVADLYRTWWPPQHGASHAVVSTGRMTDPWEMLDAGMVPYWGESSSRPVADAAELWLAGSRPYDRISVLPEPPGTAHDRIATLAQWRSVAAFARRGGTVSDLLARRYPTLPTAAGHATDFVRRAAVTRRRPEPIPIGEAVRHLAEHGSVPGLMVA
ncbi:hypothetical protein [Actinoplanes sp. DH11]|uniref:hypothetical protein n=1 Tax=Actinoplanes sp. DH11 TaxID=2857011 RepID=UPI001E536118|nr:hypothetical protein [Actinoplanes sp. DH11]